MKVRKTQSLKKRNRKEKKRDQHGMFLKFIDLSNHRVRCVSEKNIHTQKRSLLTKTEKKRRDEGGRNVRSQADSPG